MTGASSRSTARTDRAAAGARAEAAAARVLVERGLAIVARNFRTRHGEIDLIVRDGAVLVFVEVRRRTSARFGGAAASITAAKQARWTLAARAYLARFPDPPACRFDAVLLDGPDPPTIDWRRDVIAVE
ncbi:MAG: YraN family protein [Betaproteobacteria bacterium]